jgi:hypothetical protein
MGRLVGNVAEKGVSLSCAFLDELNRPVGQVVRHVALASVRLSILLDEGIKIVAPVAGTKSDKLVKAPAIGMIGIMGPVVPLAKDARCIAGFLEKIGQRHFIETHVFLPARDPVDSGSLMKLAG